MCVLSITKPTLKSLQKRGKLCSEDHAPMVYFEFKIAVILLPDCPGWSKWNRRLCLPSDKAPHWGHFSAPVELVPNRCYTASKLSWLVKNGSGDATCLLARLPTGDTLRPFSPLGTFRDPPPPPLPSPVHGTELLHTPWFHCSGVSLRPRDCPSRLY